MAVLNDEESVMLAIEAGRWFHSDAVVGTKELKHVFVRQDGTSTLNLWSIREETYEGTARRSRLMSGLAK